MKAAVYRQYGGPDVVRIEDIPTPTAKPGEVLIRIRAATISSADWRARALALPPGFGPLGRLAFGILGPRNPVLGMSFAGDIVALGDGVSQFTIGDTVFGVSGFRKMGCHAEFIALPETAAILPKPESISYQQAASLPFGGPTALFFLRDKAGLRPGERVLVIGASGTVGSACVQLAKQLGAHVTGVASTANLDLLRDIGADAVIDYTTEDIRGAAQRWDIIVDCVGSTSFGSHRHLLSPGGRLCFVLSSFWEMLRAPFYRRPEGRRPVHGTSGENRESLQLLADLAEQGIFLPLIDSEYPLGQAAAAHARVETGRKRGAVILLP